MIQPKFARQFVALSLALGLLAPVALASSFDAFQPVSGPDTTEGKGRKPKPTPRPPGPTEGGGGEDS